MPLAPATSYSWERTTKGTKEKHKKAQKRAFFVPFVLSFCAFCGPSRILCRATTTADRPSRNSPAEHATLFQLTASSQDSATIETLTRGARLGSVAATSPRGRGHFRLGRRGDSTQVPSRMSLILAAAPGELLNRP